MVRRDSQDDDVEIVRRNIEVPMVTWEQYGDVGYIKIKEFHNNTPAQFNTALKQLTGNGVKALIFDVRQNSGGNATNSDEVNLPMVVITNENTASAAELFAQAIKDYNKGRTVGTQTYGKGVMQTIYPLSDGGALSITVAKYNPPKSENFDGVGVKPDYAVQLTAEQQRNFYELDEETDPQLKKALELAEAVIKTGGFDGLSEIPESSPEEETEEDTSSEEETASEETSSEEESSEESSSEDEAA